MVSATANAPATVPPSMRPMAKAGRLPATPATTGSSAAVAGSGCCGAHTLIKRCSPARA